MTDLLSAAPGRARLLVNSFDEWRAAARNLLADNVAPHAAQWANDEGEGDLFSAAAPTGIDKPLVEGQSYEQRALTPAEKPGLPPLRLPRKLMEMLQAASCYRALDRWAFLYRVVWRWQHGEKEVTSAADEDGNRLHSMVKAVRREEHDMHAYVRFRERPEAAGAPRFVAWYEPSHDVLPQVARHFAKRMGRISWMIATPDATVLWDGKSLHTTGALLHGPADIDDGGEALWLRYYRSIFNPSRLNTRVMQSHIPSRFWKNLPEGKVVPAMVADAAAGARRIGQAQSVGQRVGTVIPIAAERAQPQRDAPTTLDQCRRCELWQNATQAIGGIGPAKARIMLVGEQPGDQEDIAGEPFIGPAGQLLDNVLTQAGLDRTALYLTNAVKHFKWEPRGKRRLHKTPGQREIMACRHWLQEEVASVQPDVLIALGSTALKSVLGVSTVNLTELLGKPFRHEGRWIIAVYHPAYALRVPDEALKQQALDVIVNGLRLAQRLLAAQDGAS